MSRRTLTDDQLAAGLRAHLPVAAPELARRIRLEVTTTPQQHRWPWILGTVTDADPMARRRTVLLLAVLALALATSAAAIGAALRDQPNPNLSLVPSPEPPLVVRPTPGPSEPVRGWPHGGRNPAGLYSWDGSTCSASACIVGFMHNGYGSGAVSIRIHVVTGGPVPTHGATSVVVAGHDGVHRGPNAGDEDWFVEIEGRMIAINLDAAPSASENDLADAHAIVESLRTEPWDNALGFRLVFWLPTDEWDSG